MDKLKLGIRSLAPESSSSGSGSSFDSSSFRSDQTSILVRAPPGKVVSLWTCSKICAVSFTIGVFVGFTLKRRFRQWVCKLLKRLKED